MPTASPEFPNLLVFDHPLIQTKLTRARDRETSPREFRGLLNEIGALMTFSACRHLPVVPIDVETPLERATGCRLERPLVLVPILRAGIGMTDGLLALVPEARVGHVGVYRDEKTLQPVQYYAKFPPDIAHSHVLVIDPMLATGGSAAYAMDLLKERGCTDLRLLCLVAAPDGVRTMLERHPDVPVLTAALDRELDERGYIRPGLGDAGDRIFGTQ